MAPMITGYISLGQGLSGISADHSPWPTLMLAAVAAALVTILCSAIKPVRRWLQSARANVAISPLSILFMRMYKIDPKIIVPGRTATAQAGSDVATPKLQVLCLAGGHVQRVIAALIIARRHAIPLGFDRACALDLVGITVLDAVHTSFTPTVIDVPEPGMDQPTIDGVASNGMRIRVKARVTMRTNLERPNRLMSEAIISARVSERIILAIAAAKTHLQVLENPQPIGQSVLDTAPDANPRFAIVSIDLSEVTIGENDGAPSLNARTEAPKSLVHSIP